MSIIRSPRTHNFTILDNTGPNDPRLSWGGVGLLTYLLTKQDNWQVSVAQLTKFRALGRDGVYKLLAELEECGYIKKSRAKADQGRFSKFEYVVYDRPQGDTKPPLTEIPEMDSPLPDLPDTVKPTLVNTDKKVSTENISITPYPQKGEATNGEEKQGSRNESESDRQESEGKNLEPQGDKTESKSKRREPNIKVEIPDWLKEEDWKDFKAHRKAIKRPLTDVAEKRAIKALDKLRNQGEDVAEVIDQSIVNGWQGIFPVKNKNPTGESTSTSGRAQPQNLRESNAHAEFSRPISRGERNERQFRNQLRALQQALAEEAQEELDGSTVDEASRDIRGEVVRLLPRIHSGNGQR